MLLGLHVYKHIHVNTYVLSYFAIEFILFPAFILMLILHAKLFLYLSVAYTHLFHVCM